MVGLSDMSLICFIKTSPTHINPLLVGDVVLSDRPHTLATVIDLARMLLSHHGFPQDAGTEFRGFWFGEDDWIRESDAPIGKERAGFILVVVDASIVPFTTIGAMTANIAAEPAFSRVIARVRTKLAPDC